MTRKLLFLLVLPLVALSFTLSFRHSSRSNDAPTNALVNKEPDVAEADYSRHVEQLKKKLPSATSPLSFNRHSWSSAMSRRMLLRNIPSARSNGRSIN